jgi:hypothetical protein
MNWKGFGRKRYEPNFTALFRYSPEGSEKTTRKRSQDRNPPGRNLNPGHPEYEAGVLATRPRHSVSFCVDAA